MSYPELNISEPILPKAEDIALANEAVLALARSSADVSTARLEVGDDSCRLHVNLPGASVQLLKKILVEMAQGHAVAVMPIRAELTTQQAADLLNVSAEYLESLLRSNVLPCNQVGASVRVLLEPLLAYKEVEHIRRAQVLNQMTQEAQDLGFGY